MATTPNQKPVPSEDYANMRFNAGKFDEFMTSTASSYVDRLGITHLTVKGIQASAAGALLPANNLSDVQSAATSRANLGLGTVAVESTVPIAKGGTGNTTGLAATATALATARTFTTNLASTSSASFNGTANVTPGVTGTLPIANGGTGATTAAAARSALGASASAGVTDASSASAGVVGELLTITTTGTANATSTAVNTAQLTLTAGDWDVDGVVRFNSSSAPYTAFVAGFNTTSATQPSFPDAVQTWIPATTNTQQMVVPTKRINITSSVAIYLTGLAIFASGTSTVDGYIRARRIR